MTREQKRELAWRLLQQAGDIVEFWEDKSINVEEVSQLLGQWLHKLPGDAWDTRLTYPTKKGE